jgi:predicted O-linked N-acetylglucosamine transferase (SPINDLY family)
MLSRQGASIMAAAGLGDWVAQDVNDYVRIASSRATDTEDLAALRAGLRKRLGTTPLFDAARFAAHFTQALLEMAGRPFSPGARP